MYDWSTIASLSTAAGTLVLAVATFASVRSANRAARAAETSMLAGLRPLLVPSRLDEPDEKVGFMDDHWVRVPGGRAVVEATDEVIYLTMSLRNVGRGIAILDRWSLIPERVMGDTDHADPDHFRRLTRDIYIPALDRGFWQGALRDPSDPLFAPTRAAIESRSPLTLDLLYGDYEGGQRMISRFAILAAPSGDAWLVSNARHWSLDHPDPR
ncbi:MAG TPA: hypothetical protein VGP92_16240 [Acidimicrobiia bacterium]|nr:hypothetical protein [Acidimicrobiia bacterium]